MPGLLALKDDTTTLKIDAIVNAANTSLLGDGLDEPALLVSCYQSSMETGHLQGISTIAFPGISTGV